MSELPPATPTEADLITEEAIASALAWQPTPEQLAQTEQLWTTLLGVTALGAVIIGAAGRVAWYRSAKNTGRPRHFETLAWTLLKRQLLPPR